MLRRQTLINIPLHGGMMSEKRREWRRNGGREVCGTKVSWVIRTFFGLDGFFVFWLGAVSRYLEVFWGWSFGVFEYVDAALLGLCKPFKSVLLSYDLTKIYLNYARTIEGYAWRYASLSASVVQKRLRLEKNLVGKPALREAIGRVGVHKVAMVARIASPETDQLFADKVEHMSKPAVQELAKEFRAHGDGLCDAKPKKITIELDAELSAKFLNLKKKLGNISNHEVMEKLLCEEQKPVRKSFPGERITRYIPVAKRREVATNSHNHCSYPGCNRTIDVFHHPERWAKVRNHDNIKPLCHIHHEFMHNGLVKNESRGQKRVAT